MGTVEMSDMRARWHGLATALRWDAATSSAKAKGLVVSRLRTFSAQVSVPNSGRAKPKAQESQAQQSVTTGATLCARHRISWGVNKVKLDRVSQVPATMESHLHITT